MYVGRIMGVNLRVHYLFLLPLLAWSVTGYLIPGLLTFLSVLVHEMGHLVTAKHMGLTPKEILLLPFGGVARLEEDIGLDPEQEMRVALAGPWTSLLMVGGAAVLRVFFPSQHLDYLLQANTVLALFNLLPALPLDGGRVYRAYLVAEQGWRAGTIRAVRASRFCSWLCFFLGIALMLVHSLSLNLLLIAGFLYFSSRRILEQSTYQLMAYLSNKQREIAREGVMSTAVLAVAYDCQGKDVLHYLVPKKYHFFYVLNNNGQVLGIVSEERLLQAVMQYGPEIDLRRIME